ncbi:Kiwa anti-phage protein KwaB-like domain-containing protein [Rhizorhabdus phycosphaerae]|uniref:Kiwa anti-phage protein KwaB-like domain-containing protein n=1 Tax=Rhizorhabdus phycosphaerae TaxID=2711156 RepID=UPI0013EBF2D6|nr:Kiwa anti-phage protein KwaB-like domain-containing protein [Rhizorhabdus phycosphaerae]
MAALDDFRAFDVNGGSLSLWTFRKSVRPGATIPTYTGHWVAITETLESALKTAIITARDQITETIEYDLLAQNNESSALTITTMETNAGLIVDAAQDELDTKRARSLKHLQNTDFYSAKIFSNGQTLHAVAKTNNSWRTKKVSGLIPVVFSDDELEVEPDPAFSLSKYFDFFVLDSNVLISDKGDFESVVNYKQAHLEEFTALQAEADFSGIFTDTAEIAAFVGSNKIQLRRAFAIRQKGHYKDANFMNLLRTNFSQAGLTINYDAAGRIIPCAATCPDIFQALLDHRLMSRFSEKNYDVQSTSDV